MRSMTFHIIETVRVVDILNNFAAVLVDLAFIVRKKLMILLNPILLLLTFIPFYTIWSDTAGVIKVAAVLRME
jgi:hypothetical protein